MRVALDCMGATTRRPRPSGARSRAAENGIDVDLVGDEDTLAGLGARPLEIGHAADAMAAHVAGAEP